MDSERGAPAGQRGNVAFTPRVLQNAGFIYFVGIKGTGMCALAELLYKRGTRVTGSDTNEVFYTDAILRDLGIPFYEIFDASHIGASHIGGESGSASRPDLLVYSAAYSAETNPEIARALELGIPCCKYPEALGAYSASYDSSGIAGVHGKTTVTALVGSCLKSLGLPAQVLAGSAVSSFGGRSTMTLGEKYFVAETCEYRRHFLSFHPRRIVLTSVESDHQDYYPTYEDIRKAFVEYGRLLPPGGELIYCADDPGACEVAAELKLEKPEIILVPYGFRAEGDFKIESFEVKDERIVMRLAGFPGEIKLRIPGRHTALNASASAALCSSLLKKEFGGSGGGWNEERRGRLKAALEDFSGSKRRSEILGESGGILFMDDYGHHPSAIKTTLEGLKEFYPGRRLLVSFMSHTYTRTAQLLDEFASSFESADIIFLHKIYASAREVYSGGVSGRTLFERTREILGGASSARNSSGNGERFFYTEEPEAAFAELAAMLRPRDLFITMGAGDNWKLGKKLFEYFSGRERSGPDGKRN